MKNFIDLSKLPIEPNKNIKSLVAIGEDGAIIVAQNGISKEEFEKELKTKQNELVSGVNIKTINGKSILGNGDLTFATGEGGETIDLSNYVTFGELDNKLSNYVTDDELMVEDFISTETLTSTLENYVTEDELSNKGYITEIPSDYVTTSTLENYVTNEELNEKGYLTEIPSEITNKLNEIETHINESEEVVSASLNDLNGKISANTESINDLNGKTSNIYNLGEFEKSGDAEDLAMNADYGTNRNINLMKYFVPSINKTGIIEQLVNLGDSQGETIQIITWDGIRKYRKITYVKIGIYWNRSNNPTWEDVKFLSLNDWNNRLSGAVTTSENQTINGVKTFNDNISIKSKTTIATNVDSGELKVLHNGSNKGFILRTKYTSDSILPLELLSTNGTSSYQYNFPKANGNVAVGLKVSNKIYSATTSDGLIDLSGKSPIYSVSFDHSNNGVNFDYYTLASETMARSTIRCATTSASGVMSPSDKNKLNNCVVTSALTSTLENYVTSEALESKGYLTEIPSEYITETELNNKGYITTIPSNYVTTSTLESKGYLTEIPSEYITETELNNKGYATQSALQGVQNSIPSIVSLSQSAYDALENKDVSTLYLIID